MKKPGSGPVFFCLFALQSLDTLAAAFQAAAASTGSWRCSANSAKAIQALR
jgi:hypothetical protein